MKTRTKRSTDAVTPLAGLAPGREAYAVSERSGPISERGSLDRDSVLPLELLAHPSTPAPAPEPTQRKTPKPPRPRRVVLETDDDISSIAPPALFAVPMSDAPLVASTAPISTEGRLSRAAYRIASVVLFGGLGVAAGWTLRGHSEPSADARTEPRAPSVAAAAVLARQVVPANAPVKRETATNPPLPPPASETSEPPTAKPTRIEVPVVNVIARTNPDGPETEAETDANVTQGTSAETPTSELPEFDAEAARQSIAVAEARLSGCRAPSDPTGPATVVVRYAPSGRVTTATVESGPFAGTPTGSCIAATFRSTRVPAFAGDPVTVKRTVTLR